MMSGKKMFGLLPPSSSVQGMRFAAAASAILRPTAVLWIARRGKCQRQCTHYPALRERRTPVKAILLMRLLAARWAPASDPFPLIMFRTPCGMISFSKSARTMMLIGVVSAGLRTMALPPASAGASFHAAINSGKFQGMICPTTPSGLFIDVRLQAKKKAAVRTQRCDMPQCDHQAASGSPPAPASIPRNRRSGPRTEEYQRSKSRG